MVSHEEMILRIVVGSVLGGVIGYERDMHGRPAGLRTHFLVALASATFMVVSTQFVYFQNYAADDLVDVDTSRIAASVVSGIGFLAGGAILRTGLTVQGLTTAAGMWLVSAIGLCAGGGMYIQAVAVTFLGIASLTGLRRFENKHELRRRLAIYLDQGRPMSVVVDALVAMGVTVYELEYDLKVEEKQLSATFEVRIPKTTGIDAVVAALETQEGVRRVLVRASVN